jgi:FkbM family methyltransferase
MKKLCMALLCISTPLFAANYKYIAHNSVTYPEEKVLDLIRKFLPENPIVLEAGAFDGKDTKVMSNLWKDGHIHAFEPNPASYAKLKDLTKDCANVQCYFLAVDNKCGISNFHVCVEPGNEGSSSLLTPTEVTKYFKFEDKPIQVPCTTLDTWARTYGIDHVDFMWLDLEGCEMRALEGAKELLKTVRVIYTEINLWPVHDGTALYAEVRDFLEKEGFVEIWQHFYHPIWVGNVVFVRADQKA